MFDSGLQASIGLSAGALFLLTGALIGGCIFNRRRGEWTRRGFKWHFVAMTLFWVGLIGNDLYEVPIYISFAYRFIGALADLFYLVVFIQLLTGFLCGFSGKKYAVIRTLFYVLFFFMGLFAFAILVEGEVAWALYNNTSAYVSPFINSQMNGAFAILLFLLSLGILAIGIFVLVRAMSSKQRSFPTGKAVLLFAAVFLNFVRMLYSLVTACLYSFGRHNFAPNAINFTDPIFYFGVTAVMSIIIVVLGAGKTWFVTPVSAPSGPSQTQYPPQQYNQQYAQAPYQQQYPQQYPQQYQQQYPQQYQQQYPQQHPQQYAQYQQPMQPVPAQTRTVGNAPPPANTQELASAPKSDAQHIEGTA